MTRVYDVVVVGSGFAGSLVSLALVKQGLTVLLIERGQHPRFAIGESSTPLTNLLLEDFARSHDLPEVLALSKWGTWQKTCPEVAGGLKRGFSFYHHAWNQPFADVWSRERQLLVAASPHDDIADTHWYRPDFDHYLLRLALSRGVAYSDRTHIREAREEGGYIELDGMRETEPISIRARLAIDASGSRGCLSRLLECGETHFPGYPLTQTVFAHFRNVSRVEDLPEFQSAERPPYPPDDAALHHVFQGGWIWVLRFNNGITSAGAALLPEWAERIRNADGSLGWDRLLEHLPSVQRQFARAEALTPFISQSPMPFLSARCHGPGWVMLPSAMGFVDPLLSTGFPLTLSGLHRLVRVISERWGRSDLHDGLALYAQQSVAELHRVARLIAALYGTMADFQRFVALTRLYFAAVSYAESARRLGRGDLAGDAFLLGENPAFVRGMEECLRASARVPAADLERAVDQVIAPIDVAGLSRRERRNWFPVEAGDLLSSGEKLGATTRELEALLQRSGFHTGS